MVNTKKVVGLIPAAGKGIRFLSHTAKMHKSLIPLNGTPVLERNIAIMRDQLKIDEVYILVGHKEEQLKNFVQSAQDRLRVKIIFVVIKNIEKGLADGILQAENKLKGADAICIILGDELYYKADFSGLLNFLNKDFSGVCALKKTSHINMISKNYGVEISNGLIISLIEKPVEVKNNFLGCGSYLVTPEIFDCIRNTKPNTRSGKVEFIDSINLLAAKTNRVYPHFLDGDYVNLNDIDDYNAANYLLRSDNFSKNKVSLIIPAFNEAISIAAVISSFQGKVDEIVVVNNNDTDGTGEIAASLGARVLNGSYKGYGDALKHGMDNASGDIFILAEADGSFFARDLNKILEYLKDADMVLGTRTTKQMIEQAANMYLILRIGNIVVAKLVELLWIFKKEPRLTDVGCTYRGIWKSCYMEIRGSLFGIGPEFSPEMIIECIKHNKRVIEIPVTYSGRIGGYSKFSNNIFATSVTALRMLKLIMQKKFFS